MESIVNGSAVLLPVLYTLLLVALAQRFLDRGHGLVALHRPLLAVAILVHVVSIGVRASVQRACPVTAQSEILSLVAFTVLFIYFVLEGWKAEDSTQAGAAAGKSSGVFVVAVAFVAQCAASIVSIGAGPSADSLAFWPSLHVFTGVVGISAVAVASVYGMLYLFLYRAIKLGRFGLFFQRMPDLELLGRTNYRAVVVAFVAVSLTIGGGVMSWLRPVDVAMNYTRVSLTVVLWALYGGLIVGHLAFRFGGKRLAYATVVGFLLALSILVVGWATAGGAN